MKFIEC